MYTFQYKLKKDLLQRNAASLVFQLNTLLTSVFIYKDKEERKINGKSLIGVLSGNFNKGDLIHIMIDNPEEQSNLKAILYNY